MEPVPFACAFLSEYQETHPDHDIKTLDASATEVSRFGNDLVGAKFAPLVAERRSAERVAQWQVVESLGSDFARHGKIVISTPM